jgi:hypothetical protein
MFISSLSQAVFLPIHGKVSAPPETSDIYFWQFRRRAFLAECLFSSPSGFFQMCSFQTWPVDSGNEIDKHPPQTQPA